ncbi:MAG: tRNA pseudouridine(55) synthase TruB [Coriobacteriia bacterium]|nr:tRNA pseudouridine(55) synthase TruB [Coriobacteriia bacterium]
MARKGTPTGLAGILALDKPLGITSHDVVNTVRRITNERRVGHAGTLDPLASGLLIVCVGPATRLSDYLMAGVKAYEARISFGKETTTDDKEGTTLYEAELPTELKNELFAKRTLASLVGKLEQIPPAYSAIKKEGVTAYKAARAGKELILEPRTVELFEATVLAVEKDYWELRLVVSKGFYVRSFARDLGRSLQSAAHLGALRRTASGNISIEQAVPLPALAEHFEAAASVAANAPAAAAAPAASAVAAAPSAPATTATAAASAPVAPSAVLALPFIDPVAALGLVAYEVNTKEASNIQNGRTVSVSATAGETGGLALLTHQNKLLALYERVGATDLMQARAVIPGGIPLT